MTCKLLPLAVFALSLAAAGVAAAAPAPNLAAAVADKSRPAADVARDVDRKPLEMLAFAEVKPGEKVVDLLPGRGYFTRLFAKAVGPAGKVYAVFRTPAPDAKAPPILAVAAEPGYENVAPTPVDLQAFTLPEQVDLVWTSQNYHDLHLKKLGYDVAAINRSIYAALKPGGVFIVLDHAAAPGSGLAAPDAVHRIDPAIVKREVEAAGFKFEAESTVLRNPNDDHTKPAFDPAVRGHTDQFIYKFRKPK